MKSGPRYYALLRKLAVVNMDVRCIRQAWHRRSKLSEVVRKFWNFIIHTKIVLYMAAIASYSDVL